MDYENLTELACERLEHLSDQAVYHQNGGNEVEKWLCIHEMRELSKAMDSDDDEIFYMLYHRHMSDSFGVAFEIEHGDPELMFGGL